MMMLLPIRTPILKTGDLLVSHIKEGKIQSGDIIVVSSKAVATVENAIISVKAQQPSPRAHELSHQTGRSPEFCEAMLGETERLHGTILGTCPGAALTELRPDGLLTGTILVANAGLDESNAPVGYAVGWPKDPVASVRRLRKELGTAVILTDSCVRPRRLGVTAFALAVSGLDPLRPLNSARDLFGKELHITTEAIADQLATGANFLMGNAAQSTPAVIIRDHGLTLSDWEGWVPGIEPERDLFRSL